MNRLLKQEINLLAAIALLVAPSVSRADSTRDLVNRGNAAWQQENFDEALSLYDEASVSAPESPRIYFNRGAAFYRQENYTEAIDAFKEAALRAREPGLSSRARFNLGNCAFRNAQRQRDSDLKKAIEHCQESISYYQEAHDADPDFAEAAENIEIVRLYVKVLLDEQKKQQEQQEQQQEQQENLVEKLKKLIERQNQLMAQNESLRGSKPDGTQPAGMKSWQDELTQLAGDESKLREDTGGVLVEMRQTIEQLRQQAGSGGSPAPAGQPDAAAFAAKVEEASGHVGNAMVDQQMAQDDLAAGNQDPSLVSQSNAAQDLDAAVKVLSDDQQQQQNQQQQNQDQQQNDDQQDQEQDQEQQQQDQQQDQQEQEDQQQDQQNQEQQQEEQEQQEQQARMERAEDILDEEKENQERRQPMRRGPTRPVDKDW